MKIIQVLPLAFFVLLGCGGGGSSSGGGVQTPPPPQLRSDLIGVYSGTLTVGTSVANVSAYISDSTAALIQTDGSVHPTAVGNFSKSVNGLNGSLLITPYGAGYGIDDSQNVSFITTVSGNSMVGTFSTASANGSLILNPTSIPLNYHIGISDLAGTWSNSHMTLKIDNSGTVISGTSGFGGAITGNLFLYQTANQPFVGVNFTVSVQVTVGTTTNNQSFPITGLAYMSDYSGALSPHTSFNQLQIISLGKQVPYDIWNPRLVCINDILYKE